MKLSDLPDQELIDAPPEVLIGMVRELTLSAWAMSGQPLPTYDRRTMPGRLLRLEDLRDG